MRALAGLTTKSSRVHLIRSYGFERATTLTGRPGVTSEVKQV